MGQFVDLASKKNRIDELDQAIVRVSRSTRTRFALFIPIHNYLRTHFSWYYDWHLNQYASFVHAGVLAGIFIAVGSAVILAFGSVITLGFFYLLGGIAP